jgi:tetratricopeptide (TPR) repeat protein
LTSAPTQLSLPQALQWAVSAYQSGNLAEAERLCGLILAAAPGQVDAVNVLGAIALARRDPAAALEHFTRATQLQPRFAEAHSNRGVAFQALKRWDEALASFRRVLEIDPRHADALFNQAIVLGEMQRWPQALESYERLLRVRPDHALAWNNRGNVLLQLKRADEAMSSYERALAIRPDYPDAAFNRASALYKAGRRDEALAGYERVIGLRADHAESHRNRAAILHELGRFDEALAGYDAALRLRPDYGEALSNRAGVLQELGRWNEAQAAFEQALAASPDFLDARWNQGLLHLLLGDFERGWKAYEARQQLPGYRRYHKDFAQPPWLGAESLAGKTILLHAEQGLGDTLQFSRYVPRVAELARHVVLEVPPLLADLVASLSASIEVIARGSPLPAFDFHCPLGSLPLAFGTTLATIPPPAPLRVPAERLDEWRAKLGERTRPRIGIVWAGSAENANDRRRSIALEVMLGLLDEDFEFHSLQKEPRAADASLLARTPGLRQWSEAMRDFTDTAALVENLDLVITVDTAVAHLAGTLGKPVWILLPDVPDFRWLLGRSDSPWYPSARLFRQPRKGDWPAVIADVRDALRAADWR